MEMIKMKKILNSGIIALCLVFSGCDWLDINPETGLDETEVFTIWDNYKAYFDYVYGSSVANSERNTNIKQGYPLYLDNWSLRFTWLAMTDMCDTGRLIRAQSIKAGTLGANVEVFTTDLTRRPVSYSMFKIIRICNKAIGNIDRVQNIPSEQDKNDILGQAYFVRGFAHFVLCRYFGGMPYLDKALGSEDNWDQTRLSANETYRRCAEDFEQAYVFLAAAGKTRRDGTFGNPGHLSAPDQDRPNGVAAKAMKARALLYAASPLNNVSGQKDWEDAAEASAEALKLALDNGYELLPIGSWKNNFIASKYTNEHIWAWNYGSAKTSSFTGMYTYSISNGNNASGDCPTQNFVDRYETAYGEPLVTEEDKAAAIAAGHYNPQNPYADRDPRLDMTIVHDGSADAAASGKVINIYYDPAKKNYPVTKLSGVNVTFGIDWGSKDNGTQGYSSTGYYCKKYWDGKLGSKGTSHYHIDPIVRVAELFLNYAEAVNEAYGPNGAAGGLDLTAVQAVNIIRNRVGQPDVLEKYTADKDRFRERIRNERGIELAFEGHHYYYDIRRWKTAPEHMSKTLYGMYVESIKKSGEYPIGRKFEVRPIPNNRQCVWKDYMYYLPFPDTEAYKLKNFVNWTWK